MTTYEDEIAQQQQSNILIAGGVLDAHDHERADGKLRAKVARLETEIDEWKTASGLIDSGGDPSGVKPKWLEADIHKRDCEAERLRNLVVQAYVEGACKYAPSGDVDVMEARAKAWAAGRGIE